MTTWQAGQASCQMTGSCHLHILGKANGLGLRRGGELITCQMKISTVTIYRKKKAEATETSTRNGHR